MVFRAQHDVWEPPLFWEGMGPIPPIPQDELSRARESQESDGFASSLVESAGMGGAAERGQGQGNSEES